MVAANTGHQPDISAEWALLALKGADSSIPGPQGPIGLTGAASTIPGPPGPQGNPGADSTIPGPAGTQGPPITFKGPYSNATTYAIGDGVSFGGSSWVSMVASNSGHQPDISTQWALLAQKGADSTVPGPQGIQGNPGAASTIPGPQGNPGVAGAAATVAIGAVTSGTPAQVTNTGTSTAAILNFTLPQGDPGLQGPPINFKGAYNPATTYVIGDAVSFAGSSWISIVNANTNHQPDVSPSQWGLLASKGDIGLQGIQGLTGATGATGAASTVPGPAGAPGAAGTAATITVGTTTTGASGSLASVTNVGTAQNAVFNFTIPRGDTGAAGSGGGSYTGLLIMSGGGDFATAFANAVGSCPAISAVNPCLLKILPGNYTMASEFLVPIGMDVEGSGPAVTVISGDIVSASTTPDINNGAIFQLGTGTEIRNLTVINGGSHASGSQSGVAGNGYIKDLTITVNGNTNNYGIISARSINNVKVTVSGGTGNNWGIYRNSAGSNGSINNTVITATGGTSAAGAYITGIGMNQTLTIDNMLSTTSGATNSYGAYLTSGFGSTIMLRNSIFSGKYGIYMFQLSSDHFVSQSSAFTGTTTGLVNDQSSSLTVGSSGITGGVSVINGGLAFNCIGDYNYSTGAALNGSCQ